MSNRANGREAHETLQALATLPSFFIIVRRPRPSSLSGKLPGAPLSAQGMLAGLGIFPSALGVSCSLRARAGGNSEIARI
jgi:hypothetical protein